MGFRYSPKHPLLFHNVNFGIDMDSRICIVGPNGSGAYNSYMLHIVLLLYMLMVKLREEHYD